MIINRGNERLIHAIVFFTINTNHCYALKLLKLLYFLDFEHFKQTGASVTGQKYFAWKMGPVPKKLYNEIEKPAKIVRFFQVVQNEREGLKSTQLYPKIGFKKGLFSKRQIKIMNELAREYKNIKSKDMTSASHKENSAWDKVFNKENKKNGLIPYEYALDDSKKSISKDMAKELERENKGLENFFGSSPSIAF